MANEVNLKAVITAEDRASSTVKNFAQSIGAVTSGVVLGQLALEAFHKAVNLTKTAITSSIAAYSEAQDVQAQLGAVLKSTAGAAGVTSAAAIDLSKSLEKQTTFSDEAILSAENLLLTTTTIHKEAFPLATQATLDLATAMKTDATGAAGLLAKALNDPTEGLVSLKRAHVNLKPEQIDLITNLQKSGDLLGAQKALLEGVAVATGGSAAAAAATYSGKIKQLNNDINDMQEKIGGAIVQGITPFVEKIVAFVNSSAGDEFANKITRGVTQFFAFINAHQEEIVTFGKITLTVFKAIGEAINGIVKIGAGIERLFENITSAVIKVGQAVSKVPLLGTISGAKSFTQALGFADGGSFGAGQPMVVGERGPELMVPHNAGTIIPNHQLGGDVTINFNGGIAMNSSLDVQSIGEMLASQIRLARAGGR
jgi:phage-related minor tail protein